MQKSEYIQLMQKPEMLLFQIDWFVTTEKTYGF